MILQLLVTAAMSASSLEELKKLDYSIVLKHSKPKPEERCFFRPEVNQALSRVQQRLRMMHSGLAISTCYLPGDAEFGKGAAATVKLSKPIPNGQRLLDDAMKAERFTQAKGKGVFHHESWNQSAIESAPVASLP